MASSCEILLLSVGIAEDIACGLDAEELARIAALFTVIGDQLALIAATRV